MKKEFAISEVKMFEVKTPLGPRQVRVYKKVGAVTQEVPDEIAAEIDSMGFFNKDSYVEGVGQVLVQSQGRVFPQPLSFVFGDEITTFEQAFAAFDKYMNVEVQHLQEEQKASKIKTATENDLRAIDAARERAQKSGIIVP